MNERLPIEVSALAVAQVQAAEIWWRDNRPKAPGAIRAELERASLLIALQPQVGARARNIGLPEAQYRGEYTVWLRFRDGTVGEIDLQPELYGPIFEPLHDPVVFRRFTIHPEFQTLVWPNGANFAPEFLHDNVRVTA